LGQTERDEFSIPKFLTVVGSRRVVATVTVVTVSTVSRRRPRPVTPVVTFPRSAPRPGVDVMKLFTIEIYEFSL
jgi:hypothetical protein